MNLESGIPDNSERDEQLAASPSPRAGRSWPRRSDQRAPGSSLLAELEASKAPTANDLQGQRLEPVPHRARQGHVLRGYL
jgi:hypothetical protein